VKVFARKTFLKSSSLYNARRRASGRISDKNDTAILLVRPILEYFHSALRRCESIPHVSKELSPPVRNLQVSLLCLETCHVLSTVRSRDSSALRL